MNWIRIFLRSWCILCYIVLSWSNILLRRSRVLVERVRLRLILSHQVKNIQGWRVNPLQLFMFWVLLGSLAIFLVHILTTWWFWISSGRYFIARVVGTFALSLGYCWQRLTLRWDVFHMWDHLSPIWYLNRVSNLNYFYYFYIIFFNKFNYNNLV